MEIRRATVEDAEAIRAIYNVEVTRSTVTFDIIPRTEQEQVAWLVERSGAYVVLVAEDESGTILGFASLSPFRERPAYSTTVEDSVYVDRAHRGRGVARALLEALVETATSHGFHAMIARIVGGHDASIALHEKVGFEIVGTEREVGRKQGRWLDVVVVERLLGDPAAEPPGV